MSDEESPPYEFSSGDGDSPIKSKRKVQLKKVNIPGASLKDSPQGQYDLIRIQNTEQNALMRKELVNSHSKYKKEIGLVSDEQGSNKTNKNTESKWKMSDLGQKRQSLPVDSVDKSADQDGPSGAPISAPSDVTISGNSDVTKPLSRQASVRSRSDSPNLRRSQVVDKVAQEKTMRRTASSSPRRRDRSKESEISETGSPNKKKVAVNLNPRKKVKYMTRDGKEKERNMKRSHDDEFFWDTTVQPSDHNVRKTFNRAYLAPTVYNFAIDTHTPVAIVYIDPLDEKIYFAGAGECLDFISIPENRYVEWKPPNHPQKAFMTRDFCRKLPFNKFQKPKKAFKRQTVSQWKLSDLPVATKNHQVGEDNVNIQNDDPDDDVDDNDLDASVTEVIPVVKKATRKGGRGRGGGRVGGQGGLSRGRGKPIPTRGRLDPQKGHTRGLRGARNQVVSKPTFNPPHKETTEVENSDQGTLSLCSLVAEP